MEDIKQPKYNFGETLEVLLSYKHKNGIELEQKTQFYITNISLHHGESGYYYSYGLADHTPAYYGHSGNPVIRLDEDQADKAKNDVLPYKVVLE